MSKNYVIRSRVEAAKNQNGFTYANFVHRDDVIELAQVKKAIEQYLTENGITGIGQQQLIAAIQTYFYENPVVQNCEDCQSNFQQWLQNYLNSNPLNLNCQDCASYINQLINQAIDSNPSTTISQDVTNLIHSYPKTVHIFGGAPDLNITTSFQVVPNAKRAYITRNMLGAIPGSNPMIRLVIIRSNTSSAVDIDFTLQVRVDGNAIICSTDFYVNFDIGESELLVLVPVSSLPCFLHSPVTYAVVEFSIRRNTTGPSANCSLAMLGISQ